VFRSARRQLAALVGVLHLCTACYQYVPVQAAPTVGAHVGLDINDDGRVALRDQLGPGVVRLEGTLRAVEGDAMIVQASNVTQIRGRPVPVDSVQVRVSRGHIEHIDERRLSRTRTWMIVGGAAAIVASFLMSGGFGKPPAQEPPGGPPVDETRVIP
jgi:hypothetical protein